MKKIAILVTVIIIILIIPLIFKERGSPLKDFKGVKLEELSYTEVDFVNQNDNLNLAGMLFIPPERDTFPVAIIIHGSGYSSRHNGWYLELTKYLQSNGVAVLLPDKRGSEKSDGEWIGLGIEELATDTEAAISFIKNNLDENKVTGIGVVGVSQGGWIAPVVGSRSEDISFIVDISGTLAKGNYQLRFEEINNIGQYTYKPLARLISWFTVKNLETKKSIKPFIEFNPIPYWKKIKTKSAFIAFGENDTNAPVQKSVELLKENKLDDLELKVYPNGKHAILNESRTAISSTFLNDLNIFIHKAVSPGNKV